MTIEPDGDEWVCYCNYMNSGPICTHCGRSIRMAADIFGKHQKRALEVLSHLTNSEHFEDTHMATVIDPSPSTDAPSSDQSLGSNPV